MINRLWVLVITLLLLSGGNVWATVSGQCSNCHTMHNSQDGALDTTIDTVPITISTLNRALTKGDCIGCHTGTISASVTNGIPYIMSTTLAEYGPDYGATSGDLINVTASNTLAGGTFNYVGATDNTGHNVKGMTGVGEDGVLGTTPPGWIASTFSNTASNAVGDLTLNQLTCAGTMGCHGDHGDADDFADIKGAHHGDDSTIDGSTVAKSFRFLRGIKGVEDDDWELTVGVGDHNIYYGEARTDLSLTGINKNTISYLCAQCHGLFHTDDGEVGTGTSQRGIIYSSTTFADANPWLRHPSDFSLSQTASDSEYRSYTGSDDTVAHYNVMAPLASSAPNGSVIETVATAYSDTAIINGRDDIVTCISCHRAHGSEYADLLRWDYANMQAGSGGDATNNFANKGCFACHTSKD